MPDRASTALLKWLSQLLPTDNTVPKTMKKVNKLCNEGKEETELTMATVVSASTSVFTICSQLRSIVRRWFILYIRKKIYNTNGSLSIKKNFV